MSRENFVEKTTNYIEWGSNRQGARILEKDFAQSSGKGFGKKWAVVFAGHAGKINGSGETILRTCEKGLSPSTLSNQLLETAKQFCVTIDFWAVGCSLHNVDGYFVDEEVSINTQAAFLCVQSCLR